MAVRGNREAGHIVLRTGGHGFKPRRGFRGHVALFAKPSRARQFFDRLAPRYDWINARLYRPEWRERVLSAVHGRVLDVGVGTGFTTGHVDDAVGLDLSREMLRRARYRGDLVQGDFLRAPVRSGSFDAIVFAGSFYYMDDPLTALRMAAELLKPRGAVVLLSPATILLAPVVRIFSQADYERLFREAGLRLEAYERLNWAACLVRGRKPASA